jgi:hypothetical protein
MAVNTNGRNSLQEGLGKNRTREKGDTELFSFEDHAFHGMML